MHLHDGPLFSIMLLLLLLLGSLDEIPLDAFSFAILVYERLGQYTNHDPNTPWDCHICRSVGGFGGQCKHIWHTWSVWVAHQPTSSRKKRHQPLLFSGSHLIFPRRPGESRRPFTTQNEVLNRHNATLTLVVRHYGTYGKGEVPGTAGSLHLPRTSYRL